MARLGLVAGTEQWVELEKRRARLGMDKDELAERVGISREQMGKILRGKAPNSRAFGVIERVLDEEEAEAGRGPLVPERRDPESRLVSFRIAGVYGAAEVVVEGPVENLAELEASVERLLRGQMGPTAAAVSPKAE